MMKVIDTNILDNTSKATQELEDFFSLPNNKGLISPLAFNEVFLCTIDNPDIDDGYMAVWSKFSVLEKYFDRIIFMKDNKTLSDNVFSTLEEMNDEKNAQGFLYTLKQLKSASMAGEISKSAKNFFISYYETAKNDRERLAPYYKSLKEQILSFDKVFTNKELKEFSKNDISTATIYKILSVCNEHTILNFPHIILIRLYSLIYDWDSDSTFFFRHRLCKFATYVLYKQGTVPSKPERLRSLDNDTQMAALALCFDGLITHDEFLKEVYQYAKNWLSMTSRSQWPYKPFSFIHSLNPYY